MIAPDRTVLSPNFNDAPVVGKTVIIHCTRSGKSNYALEMQATLNYMSTPGTVSSHWVIGRDGEKVRVVPDNKQGWHAQEDNDNSWGIELCQGVETDGFTLSQLTALEAVCRGYVQDFGVSAVHVTSSGAAGFVGHQETAQGIRNGKTDPGSGFPWSAFIAALSPTVPAVPSSTEQLDALTAVQRQVVDYLMAKPLVALTARQSATLRWLESNALK